ncbi:MAG: type II toxin-antitoxin system RelE/ParE family toxin [Candidatus Hinthialibacter antarcticus]|nr:type II toxin-antitoxin system RelE/ParE family toxin [Candidatus Hinthialibacter antarcticus]
MPDHKYEYYLSPKAVEDLDHIWFYSFENWGIYQADLYIDKLTAAFELLAERPKIAVNCDAFSEGYRRYQVGTHVIYLRQTSYWYSRNPCVA